MRTLGVKVSPQWLLLVQSFNVVSEGAGVALSTAAATTTKKSNSARSIPWRPNWWLQGGGFSTYAGRNALQENGLIFGLWHQF